MNRLVGAGWVLAMALGVTPAAQAQDARALFQQGQTAYQQGEYESAIAAFERAYALDARPGLQYNLAQAYGRLGRIEEERRALQTYVDGAVGAGTDANDPQLVSARARINAIDERIRRTGVELMGVPADAVVHVDGERITLELGEPIHLPPGDHEIVVSVDGYADFTSTVVVRAGDTLEVPVRLRRAEERSSGATAEPVDHTVPYVLWGIGGAGLLAGSVLGVSALSHADGAVAGTSEADKAKGLALGADIGFFGGGAAALTGLIIFFAQGNDGAERTAVIPRVTHDSASVTVLGRF